MDVIDPNENPYVAVAGRKSRNLRKKLEKIMKIEAQKMEGLKPLNDEQLVLLTTKGSVEKALHDIESIKTQLEDVARDDTLRRNREIEQLQAALQEARAKAVNVESSTCTIAHDRCSSSCEEKHRGCRPGNSDSANHGQSVAANQDLMKLNIYKLLKLFHVCTRYPLLTGNDLPPDIVYFGKCLMGEPSTSGFKETLQQSTRNAELYLDEYMGSKYEAIRGMSYVQIADIIDSLAAKFDTHAAAVPPMATQQAPPPQINFYSDEDVVRGGAVIEGAHRDDFVNKLQGVYGPTDGVSTNYPLPPSHVMSVVDSSNWTSSLNCTTLNPPTAPTAAVVDDVPEPAPRAWGANSKAGGALAAVTSPSAVNSKQGSTGGASTTATTGTGISKLASDKNYIGRKPTGAGSRPGRGPPPVGRGSGSVPTIGGRGAGAGGISRENRPPHGRT